jgi:hypothetical protein
MWNFQNVKSEPPNYAFTFNYLTIPNGECEPTFEVYASRTFPNDIQFGLYLLFMFLSQRFMIHVQS